MLTLLISACSDFGVEKAVSVANLESPAISERIDSLVNIGRRLPVSDQHIPIRQ